MHVIAPIVRPAGRVKDSGLAEQAWRMRRIMVVAEQMRALVVDDNAHARVAGVLSLRRLGIEVVEEAADGAEAILRLMCGAFGLVLMDWYMPDITGLGVLRVLRDPRFGSACRTPVIMMSAYPSEANLMAARALGITEILPKPFSISHLAKALDQVRPPPVASGTVVYL